MTKQEVDALWAEAESLNPANNPFKTGYCHSDYLRYQEFLHRWQMAFHQYHNELRPQHN